MAWYLTAGGVGVDVGAEGGTLSCPALTARRGTIVLVPAADKTGEEPQPLRLTEDQRKHLDFIEAVIARLANSSSAAKGWGLTVATVTFGFSATRAEPFVAALGIVVVGIFAVLDSYYLREERLFRFLYDAARKSEVEVYSMNKNAYVKFVTRPEVIRSWSVLGFYLPLVLAGVAALLWAVLYPG